MLPVEVAVLVDNMTVSFFFGPLMKMMKVAQLTGV